LNRSTQRETALAPQYPARDSVGKLSPFEPKLRQWLSTEHKKTKKLRRNLRSMYRDLVALGFTGSYDRVCAFARQWKDSEQFKAQTSGKGCFIPLRFACGEAFQFDWSEDFARIAGKQVKLQIAQFKLAHSRAFVLRAYYQQKHEMLFDAHWHAFQIFGGIPKRGIYDNMKTAVDSVGRGKERRVNQRFTAMVSHYLFDAQFCNQASGWEKGQIEKNVQDSRQRLWQGAPDFQSLADLNVWLEHRCKALWSELRHPELDQTVQEAFADEQGELMALPNAFDAFVEQTKRVTSTCLVHHEGNRYSVPASYANRAISLRIYADKLVMAAEGQHIAEHPRLFGSGHCLAVATLGVATHNTTGTITCLCFRRNLGRCAMVRHLLNCHPRSRSFNPSCCNAPAVTVTWWKFWPLYCTTMKVRYSVLWNWHWSVASHRRSMCLICWDV